MKFKQIAAAAALALVAASPAMALISLPQTGNGELVVVVLDRTDQASYLLDLGLSMDPGVTGASVFDGNGTYNYALGGANFSAFLSAAAATGNDFEFAVFAADQVGSTSASPRRLFSTVNQTATTLGNQLLTNVAGNTNAFLGEQLLGSPTQTHQTVDNGDSWAAVGSTAYFLTLAGDSFNNQTVSQGWLNTNPVGTNALFRSFQTSSTSGGAQTIKNDFAGVWSLTNSAGAYVLSYASTTPAIPEADGIALLLAGLGALAFVARRREEQ